MRGSERPLVVVLRLVEEVLQRGDAGALDSILAPDHIDHSGLPLEMPNMGGMKERLEAFFAAFSDPRVSIEDLVAQGGTVAWRWRIRARHTASFMGIEPAGTEVEIEGISLDRIVDDRIAESWSQSN